MKIREFPDGRLRGKAHTRAKLVRILTSLGVLIVCAISVGAAQGLSSRAGACKPRVETIGGMRAVVFCGPATATVAVAGRTLRFRGGECKRSPRRFALQLGTFVERSSTNAGRPFFSLIAPARGDGLGRSFTSMLFSYRGVPFVVGGGGRGFSYRLSNNRSRGTFSGIDNRGDSVRGSFAC